MRIGQARLTAGLDRFASIGLREHEEIFGSLRRMATAQLIDLAESVDLRGRGGAAFPFGHKLRAVAASAAARGGKPVVLVNGSEGEPGSAKDAMLLSRSPYLVMAGALLACQALGAREIVVGVAGGALAGLVATALPGGTEPAAADQGRPGAGQVRVRGGRCAGQRGQRARGPAPRAQAQGQRQRGGRAAHAAVQRGDVRAACRARPARAGGVRLGRDCGRAGHGAADRRRLRRPPGGGGGSGGDRPGYRAGHLRGQGGRRGARRRLPRCLAARRGRL